jgi:predicted deacylase
MMLVVVAMGVSQQRNGLVRLLEAQGVLQEAMETATSQHGMGSCRGCVYVASLLCMPGVL